MSLLSPILSIFVLINLALCWHQCTEFSVQQYLCNYTLTDSIPHSSCSRDPTSNCFYDNATSKCICKYLSPCWEDDPGSNSYRLLQLNYSISLQLDNNNKQGIFSLSNLTTSYLQDVTTLLNSSLIPTGVNVSYYTWCDGPMSNFYYLLNSEQVLFNTTTNFTFDHNCDTYDKLILQFVGQPIYNYSTNVFYLYEYKGTYYIYQNDYINGYGSMLTPEKNSLSNDYGNFTCLSFNSIPDPPTFQDHCNKYISRSLYNDIPVLVVDYEYSDSDVLVSVSTNNLVTNVYVYSGIMGISANGAGIQNETSSIPPNITNYIHHYDHRLTLYNTSFEFFHEIVLYNQNSYINETHYFTYDDSCTIKTIYDNNSFSYLTNEFCCVEWQIAGIVSPTSSATTVSPTPNATTVSATANPTTVFPTSSPTTVSPTSNATTVSPTASLTTVSPTPNAATVSPTPNATTVSATTSPTTVSPTSSPTTGSPMSSPSIVSATSSPTTVSPTASLTTVSPTSNATITVRTSQSTTFTTSTVHPSPSSNTCPNGRYQTWLASISIWMLSVCALLSRS